MCVRVILSLDRAETLVEPIHLCMLKDAWFALITQDGIQLDFVPRGDPPGVSVDESNEEHRPRLGDIVARLALSALQPKDCDSSLYVSSHFDLYCLCVPPLSQLAFTGRGLSVGTNTSSTRRSQRRVRNPVSMETLDQTVTGAPISMNSRRRL